jgi:hypothetical protein
VMASYREAMAGNPMMFSAARPVPAFLKSHPELLIIPSHRPRLKELYAS